jgi:hypothetical protein
VGLISILSKLLYRPKLVRSLPVAYAEHSRGLARAGNEHHGDAMSIEVLVPSSREEWLRRTGRTETLAGKEGIGKAAG